MSTLLATPELQKDNSTGPYEKWPALAVAAVMLFWYSTRAIHQLLGSGGDPYKILGSFWSSGWAASQHLNPYGDYPLVYRFLPYYGRGPLMVDVNLNPPCMLPLFQLLALFPLRSVIVPWTLLSVSMFVSGATLLFIARRGEMQTRQILWLLLSDAVMNTLWYGETYPLIFLLACIIWLLVLSERTTAAGVCIGILIAIKPNLGLWPLLLFLAGYRRPAILAAGTGAALTALAALVYGPGIYRQWLHASSLIPHYLFASDMSFIAIFTRLGHPAIGVGIAVACGLLLLRFVHDRHPSMVDVCGIAVCAGILCSPLAWHHYVLFAAPFFVTRRWGRAETLAAFLMALPPLFEGFTFGVSRVGELLVTAPHLIGVLMMAASFMKISLRSDHIVSEHIPLPTVS